MKISKYMALGAVIFSFACADDSAFPGYEVTESGLYYTINESGEGDQVEMEDIVTIDLKYGSDDSTLYDSEAVPFPTQLRVGPAAYNGDVMEGFTMLSVGDDASFKTSADSFFTIIAKSPMPDFIAPGSYLTFDIKILKAQTYDELSAEKEAEAAVNKEKETELMTSFLSENSITAEPTESGLIYVEQIAGDGPAAERGSMVKVHYIGRLLTGEKFDASHDRGEPIEFTLGAGQVIPGWDEGIGMMNVGGKATLIIPSSLAYGENPPAGSIIGAYSPLVFDVELLEVN
jgi:FKBP-type peptidyl-prolyl cis-trans isomerase